MNDQTQGPPPPPSGSDPGPPPPPPSTPPPAGAGGGGGEDVSLALWPHLGGAILSLICITALLSWAPALVFFLTQREKSRFMAFHSLQALMLFGAVAAINLLLWCAGIIGLAILTTPIALVINIGAAVYGLIIGLKAKDGEWAEYAVAGEMARKQLGR